MATGRENTKKSDFQFSQKELDRIRSALTNQEFVQMLTDYARELRDPENRAKYERELCQYEAETRGQSLTFLHPKPSFVIKVLWRCNSDRRDASGADNAGLSNGTKVFINVGGDKNVGRPLSSAGRDRNGNAGLTWRVPYSTSGLRNDLDRDGDTCKVCDVVFHPDTLHLANKDARFKELMHKTALDAAEQLLKEPGQTDDGHLDRTNLRFPKMKYKGLSHPTVIRNPLESSKSEDSTKSSSETSEHTSDGDGNTKVDEDDDGSLMPKYSIRYQRTMDIQDFVVDRNPKGESCGRKQQDQTLVVDIELPLLDSASGIDLDVQEKSLKLVREDSPRYNLELALPVSVNEEAGSATFDKTTKRLAISLPIKQMSNPGPIAERLCSNDSGIGLDEPYRTKSEQSVVESDDEEDCEADGLGDKESDADDEPVSEDRTKSSATAPSDRRSKGKTKKASKSKNSTVNVSRNAEGYSLPTGYRTGGNDDDEGDGDEADKCDRGGDDDIEVMDAALAELADFLSPDLSYSLPAHTGQLGGGPGEIIFTMEVKNVSEDTVEKKWVLSPETGSVFIAVKFASIGSGMYPMHHAFAVELLPVDPRGWLDSCTAPESVQLELECWDNNLVLQVLLDPSQSGGAKSVRGYRAGQAYNSLKETVHKLERTHHISTEIGLNDEESQDKKDRKKKPKYSHEKHPKLMSKPRHNSGDDSSATELTGSKENRKRNDSKETDTADEEFPSKAKSAAVELPRDLQRTNSKERHSSGESLDSYMSLSPYERVNISGLDGRCAVDNNSECGGLTTESEMELEFESEPHRFARATSVDSQGEVKRLKSILKRSNNDVVIQGRFRCYSESNVTDMGWQSSLTASLSNTRIEEEGEEELPSSKKSVTFSEKVHQQIFRIGSTILAKTAKNRRKAEKKRRALERRFSESDSTNTKQQDVKNLKKSASEEILSTTDWSTVNKAEVAKSAPLAAATATTPNASSNYNLESYEDSGLSSSLEENVVLTSGGESKEEAASASTANGGKTAKRKRKRKTKQFELAGDLIFNMDI